MNGAQGNHVLTKLALLNEGLTALLTVALCCSGFSKMVLLVLRVANTGDLVGLK